ncbi:MAG: hypothetical protein R3321_11755, partial [Nitrososphaeraceae archaeon]|nr:hypothetical protein [Nitrososphaeraceae archaeon]
AEEKRTRVFKSYKNNRTICNYNVYLNGEFEQKAESAYASFISIIEDKDYKNNKTKFIKVRNCLITCLYYYLPPFNPTVYLNMKITNKTSDINKVYNWIDLEEQKIHINKNGNSNSCILDIESELLFYMLVVFFEEGLPIDGFLLNKFDNSRLGRGGLLFCLKKYVYPVNLLRNLYSNSTDC